MDGEAWLSLVERCVRDAEVAGSNPVASISKNPLKSILSGDFLFCASAPFSSVLRFVLRNFLQIRSHDLHFTNLSK